MREKALFIAVVAIFLSSTSVFATSNTLNMTTLTIVGLPPGATLPLQIQNPLGVYSTINYSITNWTTMLTVPYNTLEMNTYHGNIPYQLAGAGTTDTYHGTVYTINESSTAGFNGFIMSNSISYMIPYYAYFNASKWSAIQANELEGLGISSSTAMLIAGVKNVSQSLPFGSVTSNGIYTSAGGTKSNASVSNHILTFTNTSVAKAPASCQITADGATYAQPGTYPLGLVEVNGKIGIGSQAQSYYWLNGTFSCSNLNSLQLNYSLSFSNGTKAVFGTPHASTLSQSFSYKVSASMGVSAEISAQGNSNYTTLPDPGFTLPATILYYCPLTIQNTQSSAYTANTPVAISVNTIACGWSQGYLDSNGMNAEIFYNNGTVASQWLEGNVFNERSSNVISTNTLYWVRIPNSQNLLSSSNTLTNTLYYGIAGTSNNLFTGASTGESPLLSTTYGQYDNGVNVFATYQNFASGSCPSSWTCQGSGIHYYNGVSLAFVNPGPEYLTSGFTTYYPGNILDEYGYINEGNNGQGAGWETCAYRNGGGSPYTCAGNTTSYNSITWAGSTDCSATVACPTYLAQTTASATFGTSSATLGTNTLFSILWSSATSATFTYNYGNANILSFAAETKIPISLTNQGGGGSASPLYISYIRVRASPPNGIPATVTQSALQSVCTPVVSTSFTASNSILDPTQYETFTASWTGTCTPFSANFLVYSSTNTLYASNVVSTSSNTASYTVQITSLLSGVDSANVVITDSASNIATNSIGFTTENTLTATALTPNAPTIDSGQSIILSEVPTGGESPYIISFFSQGGCTGAAIGTSAPGTSSSISTSPTSTTTYSANVVDSLPNNGVACTATNDIVTVSPAYSFNSLAPSSNTPISFNAIQTITGTITGGTANYIYSANVYAPNGLLELSIGPGSNTASTSNTFSYSQSPLWGSGTCSVTFYAKDSAYSPQTVSNTITYQCGVKKTTALSFPNFPGSGTSAVTYTVLGQINTTNNQLNATLYVDGNPYSTFNSLSLPYVTSTPGTYNFSIVTPGNSNYAANQINASFTIVPASIGQGGGGGSGGSNYVVTQATVGGKNKTTNATKAAAAAKSYKESQYSGPPLQFYVPQETTCTSNLESCVPELLLYSGVQMPNKTAQPLLLTSQPNNPIAYVLILGGIFVIVALVQLYRKARDWPTWAFCGIILILAFIVAKFFGI